MMDFKARSLLGVDIGSYSVKIVETRRTYGGGVILTHFGIQEIGQQRGIDPRSLTVDALRRILEAQKIKTKRAVCAIGGSQVLIRRILLPLIPEKEWPEAVAWEARNQSQLPLEQCLYGYHVLGRTTDRDGIEKTAVLLAIIPEETALSLLDICKDAGLQPVGLTIIPVALWKLILLDGLPQAELAVHLDIGAQTTQMLFFREGKLQFTREILTGGQAVTEALIGSVISGTARLDLNEQAAEALKREIGIPSDQDLTPLSFQGIEIPPGQIAAMMRPALERLLTEIHRSFDYYHEQFGPAHWEGVTLSGGGTLLKNLIPFLSQGLGAKVEKIDPFRGLQMSPTLPTADLREIGPCLAVATGLPLQRGPQLDLLPPRIKREQKMKVVRALSKAAAVVALLAVTFLFLLAQVQSYYYRSALAGRKIESSNLKPLVEDWERMMGLKDATARKLEIYEQLVLREPMMHAVLKEISRLTPKEIQLTEISYAKGKPLRLKGLAFSSQGPERALAQYMRGLASSPFFKEIDLYSAKEADGYDIRASQFELGLSLR